MKKLGKKLIKNEDVSAYGILVCITAYKTNYIGNNLFYFNELPNYPEDKLQIIYNSEYTAPEIQKRLYEDSNNGDPIIANTIIAIDDYFFTSDKLLSRFGWVFEKYIVVPELDNTLNDDLKFKVLSNNRICSRCNNNFSETGNGGGKICFKCGLYSNDPIYNQTK